MLIVLQNANAVGFGGQCSRCQLPAETPRAKASSDGLTQVAAPYSPD